MKEIRVKDLVMYNRFSERRKQNFINKLKIKTIEEKKQDGGDYWKRSLSALENAFKKRNIYPIKDKISQIEQDCEKTNITKTTLLGYEANLKILYNYENKDISEWCSEEDISILSQPKKDSIIQINKLPIKISPSLVYSYEKEDMKYVGGIWFLALKDGYTREELGTFSEAMYIYLSKNFGSDYVVSEENCRVIDVMNMIDVNYSMINRRKIPSILNKIIEELNNLL